MGWLRRRVENAKRRVANSKEANRICDTISPRIYDCLKQFPESFRTPLIEVVSYTREYGVTGYVFVRFQVVGRVDPQLLDAIKAAIVNELPYGYRLRLFFGPERVYPPSVRGPQRLTP